MPAIAYILNTVLVAQYCKVISRRAVIFIGLTFFSVSLYLIGTSPMLGFRDSQRIILSGLMLLGFSAAMITIPLLPEVLNSLELEYPNLAGEELNNVVAGYFNSCIGIGEALGPISAGWLVSSGGFRGSCDIIGTVMLSFTILFFICNGHFYLLMPTNISSIEDEDDNYAKCKDFESIGPSSDTLETETCCTTMHTEA